MKKSKPDSNAIKLALLLAFLAAPAAGAAEQDEELPWQKGALQLGGLVTVFNSELTFGVSGGGNSSLNGEDLLGLDSSLTVFRVDAMVRPGSSRRHQLEFTYASFDRDGSTTLTRDIIVDGETHTAGAQVDTVFNFDLFRGTYSYALVQNRRARIALGLGLYGVPLEYGLNIESTQGRTFVEGTDTTLPLPAVALRCEVLLVPDLFLMASADGMYLEFSDFKGSMADMMLGVEYRPWRHFGLGVGYSFLGVHVEGEGDSSDYPGVDFVGTVDVRYSGLLLYGKVSF